MTSPAHDYLISIWVRFRLTPDFVSSLYAKQTEFMLNNITGIKETCLYIHDLEAARTFYHEKLMLPIIHHEPGKHIFFRAGRSVLLCFNPRDSVHKTSPPPHYAEGNQHLAFEVPPEEYDQLKTRFERSGIPITDRVTWGSGQESFYFEDPEKNVLEIVPIGVWD